MALPADSPARQLAETLLSQQETTLTELGLELGLQYHLSHAEQSQLATETANNAISDQSIGELARILQQNGLTDKSYDVKTNVQQDHAIEINRSVGAAAKNYPVKLLDSRQHAKLSEGQKIEGTAFAGKRYIDKG